MALTLAEEFLLLVFDDDRGKPMIDGTKMDAAVAGAAIVELTLDGALGLSEKGRLVRTGRTPADPRLAELVEVVDGRKPKDAVSKVSGVAAWRNRSRGLRAALLADLAEAGALTEEKYKILKVFPSTAWKPGDGRAEAEILGRVRAVVVGARPPEDRTAALVSILHATDVLPKLFPDADKKAVKRRGKEISDGGWGGPAVRQAIQEVNAVMIAIMVSTSVGATAASS